MGRQWFPSSQVNQTYDPTRSTIQSSPPTSYPLPNPFSTPTCTPSALFVIIVKAWKDPKRSDSVAQKYGFNAFQTS